jgi:lysophospholipase L1-like esterase
MTGSLKVSAMKNFRGSLTFFVLALCVPAHGWGESTGPSTTNASPVSPDAVPAKAPRWQLIPAANAHFRYEGQIDFSNQLAPVIIWQATRIRIDFEGPALALLFDDTKGQCFFNASVDDSNTVVELREGSPARRVAITGLGDGRHRLELFKRSEANAGKTRFRGIEIAANTRTWAPGPPDYKLRMEFIGDSITVGACNEDGSADQWEDRRTHNGALSYATLTADAFSADCRNISVSGMGVATGWVPVKAGEIWDRLYPDPAAARADLAAWTPGVVLINLGENDDSYPRAHGQSFPTNYADNYVALVQSIRRAWPAAQIVLLRGGMYGGARSESLRTAWEAAVAGLEAKDPHISDFVFTHWTSTHPRVADDRAMADELIAWLKQQAFMRVYF